MYDVIWCYTLSAGITAVSGNLILSSVFALVNGTAHIICVFTVLEPELWMNLVKSAFMMWPIFIKIALPPPPLIIKRQWETGGTTSYTRPDSTWPGGYHNVYTPTHLLHSQGFKQCDFFSFFKRFDMNIFLEWSCQWIIFSVLFSRSVFMPKDFPCETSDLFHC